MMMFPLNVATSLNIVDEAQFPKVAEWKKRAEARPAYQRMINSFDLPGDNPTVSIVGSPIKYTKTKTGLYQHPPKLGEHTDDVFEEFGIKKARE